MRQVFNVLRRELYGYFISPVAYIFLIIFLMMCGWLSFEMGPWPFYKTKIAELRNFFFWHPWIYLIFVPSIAMRLWAEEHRSGTVQLLLTLPITSTQAVIGKFLAAWIFLGIGLALTFPMPISVGYLGDPDWGVIIASYIGSFLMAGAYLSVGSLTSAMTRNQIVSFILGVVICFFMLLAGVINQLDLLKIILPANLLEFVASVGFWAHYESIQRGVVDFRDVFYFISFIVAMLTVNVFVLESRKA